MKASMLNGVIDERFWQHRQRSSSLAGIIGGVLAICLFGYRFYVNHVWSWDLFAVAITIVAVKMTLIVWYRLTD
jgi:hypothetical protein